MHASKHRIPRQRSSRCWNRPAPTLPPPVDCGERLGPYRLCFEIASGGMGTLYLARVDLIAGIHRFVAVKRMHPQMANVPGMVEMFLDEARIASQIGHANVCSVIDVGADGGDYFIAMEYLQGETVSAIRPGLHSRSRDLTGARIAAIAARIVAEAAEGLHAAHELRDASGAPLAVVHRDVSPDNIFVTYDGTVKVLDFGVACAERQRHETRTGTLKGKYAYIQPEALRGEGTDRRGDVWGLGVVLWELLTLKRLFQRKTEMETLQAVLDGRIPAPSEVRSDLPAELDAIVLRALSRNPAERYATARDLGRELTRFLAERRTAMSPADLSEMMSELFPAGAARKRQLLELANRVDDSAEPATLAPGAETPPLVTREESRTRIACPDPPARRKSFPKRAGLALLGLSALGAAAWFAGRPLWHIRSAAAETSHVVAPPEPPPPGNAIRIGQSSVILEIANEDRARADGVLLRIREGTPPAADSR